MNFFQKLFKTKDEFVITNYRDFWNWFMLHKESFYASLKNKHEANENFIEVLIPKLHQINGQFYCLAGMYDDNTAELVISAEGDIKTFVFVEELVAAAPTLPGWKFTALKPAMGIGEFRTDMNGYQFDENTISFLSTEHADYPDEIDITFVHKDYNEENKNEIGNGMFIYLDNALGELNLATMIDNIKIDGTPKGENNLIPLQKLPDFLAWREREFIEKYKGARYNTDDDTYSSLETEDKNGMPMIAIVNQQLSDWNSKPSHPWMMIITIKYKAKNNGMPDNDIYALMNEFEDNLVNKLPDAKGYLNLGRETYNGSRKIYFACKEFRQSSKIVAELINAYHQKLDTTYTIYKDKYWMTMNRFSNLS